MGQCAVSLDPEATITTTFNLDCMNLEQRRGVVMMHESNEFSAKRYQWTAHLLNCSFRTCTVTIWLWNGPQRPLCLDLLLSCWHYFGRTMNVSKVGCWGSELLEWVLEIWELCLFLVHPMLPDFILTFNCKSTQTCSSFSCFLSSICSSIARRKAIKTYA